MKVPTNLLPLADLLHELLRYDPLTGYLHYRQLRRGRARDDINRPAGSVTGQGYRQLEIEGTFYYAHRLIWHMIVGPIPQGHYVDHRKGERDLIRLIHPR